MLGSVSISRLFSLLGLFTPAAAISGRDDEFGNVEIAVDSGVSPSRKISRSRAKSSDFLAKRMSFGQRCGGDIED
jgi:hypothetical protein